MKKKLEIEVLELDALAKVLGHTYGTLKVYMAEKTKNNQPLEFGEKGRYKLFGQPGKKWYAYDSEKYNFTVLTAKDIEPEL